MYWSQTESSKWSLDSLSFHPRHPFTVKKHSTLVFTRRCPAGRAPPGAGGCHSWPRARARPGRAARRAARPPLWGAGRPGRAAPRTPARTGRRPTGSCAQAPGPRTCASIEVIFVLRAMHHTGAQTIVALTLYFTSYIPRYLHKAQTTLSGRSSRAQQPARLEH